MNQVRKMAAFCAAVLLVSIGRTQTSVYDYGCVMQVQNTDITTGPVIKTAPCFDFDSPSNYLYPSGVNKEFRADYNIHIQDDFKMGSSSSSGGKFKLTMTNLDADLVLYEPNDLNSIPRYEKMELGVDLPDDLQARVDAFIAGSSDPNKLNPFLDWEIRITASFHHVAPGFLQRDVDAFYFRDFERVIVPRPVADGPFVGNDDPEYAEWGGHWDPLAIEHPFRIRFAPPETGTWTCDVNVFINNNPTPVYSYDVFSFQVNGSANPGYVEAGNNKRYFTRGDKTYVPIGPNFGNPATYGTLNASDYYLLTDTGNTEPHRHFKTPLQTYLNYEDNLETLSSNGVNHFRMLMVPWSLDIEFEKLGNYYDRLNIAWEIDNIVNKARENDLTIQWDLMIQYTLEGNAYRVKYWDWYPFEDYADFGLDFSPSGNDYDLYYPESSLQAYDLGYCYSAITPDPQPIPAHPLSAPYQMFTNPVHKKYYKQRLRYIISRWGYSTNIAMWELFSEINNCGGVSTKDTSGNVIVALEAPYKSLDPLIKVQAELAVEAWHEEMADYIKNHLDDPHLLSASYGGDIGEDDDTHELEDIDVVAENQYNSHWSPKFAYDLAAEDKQIRRKDSIGGGKPISFSETGTLDPYDCNSNPLNPNFRNLEIRRLMWMLPFTGVAMANDWTMWPLKTQWGLYQKVRDFIGETELDGDNWQPGQYATPYTNSPSAWNDMKRADDKAVMSYLQSGDKKFAMGVITNCTYNPYSVALNPNTKKCLYEDYPNGIIRLGIYNTDPNDGVPNVDYRIEETISYDPTFANFLRVRGMSALEDYQVDYYYIDDPLTPIPSATQYTSGTGSIILQHPDLDADHLLVAFKIRPVGAEWKNASAGQGHVQDLNEITMEAYPIPTSGQVMIEVNGFDPENKGVLLVHNAIGKVIMQAPVAGYKTNIDLSAYENGIYLVSYSDGRSTQTVRVSKTN